MAAAGASAADGPPVADEAWVIRRAQELLDMGSPHYAGEIVREALDVLGRRADLLWILTAAEFADGELAAGREHLDEALAVEPRDAASAARQIRTLSTSQFWRDALSAVDAAGDLREDPLVRAAAGDFFRDCRCPAHAADSYGSVRGLRRSASTSWWWCWLRSGGPFGRLRRQNRALEEASLQELRYPPPYIASLTAVGELDGGQVRRTRAQLETNGYRYVRRWHKSVALNRVGYRLIPLAVVPVWLVLLAAVSLGQFSTGPAGAVGFAALSAAVATVPVIAAVRVILRPDGEYRPVRISPRSVVVYLFAVMAAEAAVAEGYAHHTLASAGLPGAVVFGLLAVPAAVACLPVAFAAAFIPQSRWVRQAIRQDSLLQPIDLLLDVLHDLRSGRDCPSMSDRLRQSGYLEVAARRLTRDVLPEAEVSYLGSSKWLARRAAGWAEAIRHMQRHVIAPVPDGQNKIEALLAHEIRCLVTGDLGALAWREPPPPPSRRATLRRQVISAARAVTVAALPLAAVLAAQPLVHASSAVFGWARIATAVWALLYVLLSIDPAMRDKISAARDVASLMQTAPTPANRSAEHRQDS